MIDFVNKLLLRTVYHYFNVSESINQNRLKSIYRPRNIIQQLYQLFTLKVPYILYCELHILDS